MAGTIALSQALSYARDIKAAYAASVARGSAPSATRTSR